MYPGISLMFKWKQPLRFLLQYITIFTKWLDLVTRCCHIVASVHSWLFVHSRMFAAVYSPYFQTARHSFHRFYQCLCLATNRAGDYMYFAYNIQVRGHWSCEPSAALNFVYFSMTAAKKWASALSHFPGLSSSWTNMSDSSCKVHREHTPVLRWQKL